MTMVTDLSADEKRTRKRVILGLVLLAFLVHLGVGAGGVGSFEPLNYDDPQVLELAGAKTVRQILTESTWYAYKPVYFLSLKFDTLFGSATSAVAHVHNLLLHVLAAALLFLVLAGVLGRRWLAGVAVAFFAVHAVHVESVAWISGRKDALSLVLILAGHLLYRRARDRGRVSVGLPILLVLAGLTKGTVWIWPGLLLLDEIVWGIRAGRAGRPGAGQSAPLRAAVLRLLPGVLVGLGGVVLDGVMAVRYGPGAVEHGVSTVSLAAAAAGVHARYVWHLLAPFGLSLDYGISPEGSWATPLPWVGLCLLLAVLALLFRSWKRGWIPGVVAAGFWLFGLLPVNDLWPRTAILMADRYLYVPAIGFFVLVAVALDRLRHRGIAFGLVLAFFAVPSLLRTPVFHDSERVWKDATEKVPGSALAWIQWSEAAAAKGRWAAASERAETAIALEPRPELMVKARLFAAEAALGTLSHDVQMGRVPSADELEGLREKADAALEFALALGAMPGVKQDPRQVQAEAWVLRGQALELARDPVGALDAYDAAVDLWPQHAAAHYNLATLLMRARAADSLRLAEGHLLEALDLQPSFLDAQLQLANALALQRRGKDALEELDRAEKRHGRTADILFARAQVHLAGHKDVARAKELLTELEQWYPGDPRAARLLGDIHLAEGRLLLERGRRERDPEVLEAALVRFDRAAHAQGRRAEPEIGAGDALLQLGRFREAGRRYRMATERDPGRTWIERLTARAALLEAAWIDRNALDDADHEEAARLVADALDPAVTRIDLGLLPLSEELPYLRAVGPALDGPYAAQARAVLDAAALAVTGDEAGALEDLDRAVADLPDEAGAADVLAAALLLRGVLRAEARNTTGARRDYALLGELRPDDPLPKLRKLTLALGEAGAELAVARSAVTASTAGLEPDPVQVKRFEEASKHRAALVASLSALADAHPEFLEAGLHAAEAEMASQDWIGAIRRLNVLRERHPRSPSVLRGEAAVYVQQYFATQVQEVRKEAIHALDKALLLDPRDPRTFLDASNVRRIAGDLGGAIVYAEKARALELVSGGAAARALADLQLAIGRQAFDGKALERAMHAAERASDADPGRAGPWLLRGDVYLQQKLYDRAFDAYRMAKELEPASFEAAAGLAGIHAKRAQIFRLRSAGLRRSAKPPAEDAGAEAKKAWEARQAKILAAKEAWQRQERVELEAALRLAPQSDDAKEWRARIATLRPQDPEVRRQAYFDAGKKVVLAQGLLDAGKSGEALRALREALGLWPDNARAHLLRVATLYDLVRVGTGRTEEAKKLEWRWINEALDSLQALDSLDTRDRLYDRHRFRGLLNEVLYRRSGNDAVREAALKAYARYLRTAEGADPAPAAGQVDRVKARIQRLEKGR